MDILSSITTENLKILGIYIPILASFIFFIYNAYKDRSLKNKEYADKIRKSAGTIIAKLTRWKTLSLRFFEDIAPLLTLTDFNLKQEADFNKARYDLWIGLEETKAISAQRIADEQIEIAYIDLFGYDPVVEDIFQRAINELKEIDRDIYIDSRILTQEDIVKIEDKYNLQKEIILGELGYNLRETCGRLGDRSEIRMYRIINPVKHELLKLINATDKEIVEKKIKLRPSHEIFEPTDSQEYSIIYPKGCKRP